MSADADHWWRNRREASANSGDAWSGGAGAYRRWMGAEPAREPPEPVQAPRPEAVCSARPGSPPDPAVVEAVATTTRPGAGRGAERSGPPNPRSARRRVLARGRGVRGCSLGLAAAGLAAVVFLAPLAWAGRSGPCEAAEVALVDKAVRLDGGFRASQVRVANWTGPDGRLFSHGTVGRQIAAEEHAGWPAFAGCTALFWRARSEAASVDGIMISLLRGPALRR
jgi:hypothetical protein